MEGLNQVHLADDKFEMDIIPLHDSTVFADKSKMQNERRSVLDSELSISDDFISIRNGDDNFDQHG